MNTTKRVMIASACGAVIGYALSAYLLSGYGLVGILVGAFAGWFLYDPRGFFTSLKEVTGLVAQQMGGTIKSIWEEDWKKTRWQFWRHLVDRFVVTQIFAAAVVNIVAIGRLFEIKSEVRVLDALGVAYFGAWILSAIIPIGSLFVDCLESEGRVKMGNDDDFFLPNPKRALLIANPFTIAFTGLWFLGKGLVWLARQVPTILRFFILVSVLTCRLAHNNGRLASAMGAASGAVMGLIFGHVLVAILVGAGMGGIIHVLGKLASDALVTSLKAEVFSRKTSH